MNTEGWIKDVGGAEFTLAPSPGVRKDADHVPQALRRLRFLILDLTTPRLVGRVIAVEVSETLERLQQRHGA